MGDRQEGGRKRGEAEVIWCHLRSIDGCTLGSQRQFNKYRYLELLSLGIVMYLT